MSLSDGCAKGVFKELFKWEDEDGEEEGCSSVVGLVIEVKGLFTK